MVEWEGLGGAGFWVSNIEREMEKKTFFLLAPGFDYERDFERRCNLDIYSFCLDIGHNG